MSVARRPVLFPLLTAAAICMALGQTGCQNETSTTTVQTEDAEPLFDGTSGQTDRSPWAMPPFALNVHAETRTTAWTLDASVGSDARPGGMSQGRLASGQAEVLVNGQVVNELVPTGSRPKVMQTLEGFMGTDSQYLLCRGTDDVLYNDYLPNRAARLFLPRAITVGTTWTSDMDQSGLAGKAFAYSSVGTIACRPTIATIDLGLLAGADPYVDSGIMAVDAGGNPTIDSHEAAITYTSVNGFAGTWLDVRRSGRFEILAVDATTPDGHVTGCLRVALHFTYALIGGLPSTATTVLGLDRFSGGYILYWKPGIGWVHWSGGETTPQWGYQALASPTLGLAGTWDLAGYNWQYDSALFTTSPAQFTYAYSGGWLSGYQAGYRDVSYPPGQDGARESAPAALNTYLIQSGLTDAIVATTPYPSVRAARAARQPAFLAGFAAGAAYYDSDFIADPDNYDTLASGQHSRNSLVLHPNHVPAQFRADHAVHIDTFGSLDRLAGFSDTGAAYAHGYDGMGVRVDAYDPAVTVDPLQIRVQQDPSGNSLRGIYIALPVIGSVTTRTLGGAITQTVVVGADG